jgi:hypothetical protein
MYILTGFSMGNQTNYSDKYDVFLTYRRDGGETMAILLRDRLTAKGYRVFLDIESLNSGSFNEKLLAVIEGCTDLLVVSSKGSLDRCVNEGDWVRAEIAHALKNSKNVVPVMLRGFDWPDVLPADIEALRMQNGVTATSNEYFDAAIDRLTEKFMQSKPQGSGVKKPRAKKTKGILAGAVLLAFVAVLAVGGIVIFVKTAPDVSVGGGTDSSPKAENPLPEGARVTPTEAPGTAPGQTVPPAQLSYITINGNRYSLSLTKLELNEMKLQNEDIVPLQHMTNLTELWLGLNQISDISPLKNLTSLTILNLYDNQISDLSPLSNLTNLTSLSLYENKINNISPLKNLRRLNVLYLSWNQISDISPLKNLTNLKVLSLNDNKISDLTPLSNLVNLEKLDLQGNQIQDWSPAAHVPDVQGGP